MDNTQKPFVRGLVLSEAAANVPTSAFLVCHSQRCELQADIIAQSRRKRQKGKKGEERNPHYPLLSIKGHGVYIFLKLEH